MTPQPCEHDGCQNPAYVFLAFPVMSMDNLALGEWFCDEHAPAHRGEAP